MLQIIRSKTESLAAKLLFVLLISCFGLWGVGDFLRQLPNDATIIKVGGTKIPAPEIQSAVDRGIEQMKPVVGGALDRAQAKQLGIVDQAVRDLINQSLFGQEINRLGLAVGDAQIQQTIEADPHFQDKTGKYNRQILDAILAQNNFTEAKYVALLHQQLPRQDLLQVAGNNGIPPKVLAALLFRKRDEKRIVDYVVLNGDDLPPAPTPDDSVLRVFYNQYLSRFTAPEYRRLTVLSLTTANVINQVAVTDDQLEDYYQQNLEEFSKEETRDVSQMLLPDQATAKQAAAALKSGTDFATVAATIAHQDPDTLKLGSITRHVLPDLLATPVFAAKSGGVTAPIKTEFGWNILKINAINPAHVESFGEAKAQIAGEVRANGASNALYELSNKVEDAIAAGADLGAIAQQFDLKPLSVKAIDAAGNGSDGNPVASLPVDAKDLTKLAFQTQQGQLSELTQTNDGPFFLVRVDGVIPATPKPFDEVKSAVAAAWAASQHDQALADEAKSLAASVTPTNTLASIATARHLTLGTTQPFARDDSTAAAPLPTDLIAAVFTLKPGQSDFAPSQNGSVQGQIVVQLRGTQVPDPDSNQLKFHELAQEVGNQLNSEIMQAFDNSLRSRFPVTINKAALDALF